MKKFIFSIMAAALLLTVSAPKASAQNFNFDPAQMAQMRVDQMKESIKLNSEQAEKLLTIFKKQSEEMSKMFEGGGMPDMNKMQENMKKQDEEIKKVLTPEQFKQYEEQQRKMREQFGGGF